MHSVFPPAGALPALSADAVRHQLHLRFVRREAIIHALVEAVLGHGNLQAASAGERLRLQALLHGRSDAALEGIARRGHAGRTRVQVRFEVLFDGEPDAAELAGMERNLLRVLHTAAWAAPTLSVRTVLLDQVTLASSCCSPSG